MISVDEVSCKVIIYHTNSWPRFSQPTKLCKILNQISSQLMLSNMLLLKLMFVSRTYEVLLLIWVILNVVSSSIHLSLKQYMFPVHLYPSCSLVLWNVLFAKTMFISYLHTVLLSTLVIWNIINLLIQKSVMSLSSVPIPNHHLSHLFVVLL